MVTEIEMFESVDLALLDFCFCVCMKSGVYKRKVDTLDELLAQILYAAACIKKCKDQPSLTTHNLHTQVAECIEVDGFPKIYCKL